tara:strand:+ start:1848 stop:2510 length:663 start_codon:yes stop_codon:yes gene_type:complete
MENSTKQLGTLETEGQAIAKELQSRDRKDANQFKRDIVNVSQFIGSDKQPKGLWVRLGHLMHQIELGNSTKVKCGINKIDRRRLAEAKWFYNNLKDCQAFIANSKKGYTSLTALQLAMSKANKATLSTEDKATDPSEATSNEVEQSNVGQAQLPTNANDLVKQVMATCKDHNIDPQEIVNLINVYLQYETKPNVTPKGKTKVTSYDVAVSDAGWKVITNA